MDVRERAALGVAGVVAGLGLGLALGNVAPAQAGQHGQQLPVWVTRPCPTDDSVNCAWDAQRQGRHGGHSFIVRQVPGSAGMVCVFYVDRRYAKHHDYCS